ncbi:kinase domain protein [Ostertagia ostertagi]
MVRLQSYSPNSGILPERPYFSVGNPNGECRDNQADSRDRECNGGPSLFEPGDRIVDEYSKEEYYVDQYLGKGGFAECFAVRSNRCRGQFALKVVEKSKLKDPSYSKMHREINLHRSVSHPNIVRLRGSFQDRHYFFLVMELCREQTLLTLINQSKRGYLSEYESRGYMVGILSAVRYLLDRNILHRDLKPGNILIGTDGQVKLADFGLAILKQDLNPMSVSGTPNYLAPEVRCLIHSANFRPTIREIQEDPWMVMCHPVPESVLHRAKSMKDLARHDANGNIITGARPHRPRSTLDLASAQTCANRSRRKSIVSTHDSGFGSDPDMSRRPALAAAVNGYLNDISGLLGGTCDFALEPCPLPPVFVSKWVDYTNRRGFGCQFSDGSISVKFNEGLCLSWPANSPTIIYAQTPFSSPHVIHPGTIQNSGLTATHIEIARQYRDYMERELADTDLLMSQASRNAALSSGYSPPYLVFTHLGSECLIMVFSDGTTQINLMKRRSKIVLWNGDGGPSDPPDSKFTSIAIIERGFAPFAYRIRPGHMYGLELPQSLEDSLFVVRRALNMECDFLHVSRRPIQSTEC